MLMYPKPKKVRDAKWLSQFKDYQCTAHLLGGCHGDVVAAHLDGAGNKGTGTKTDDCYASALCHAHHVEEGKGWARFWHKVVAEDTWFLVQLLKAYNFLNYLRYLKRMGRDKDILDLLRGE